MLCEQFHRLHDVYFAIEKKQTVSVLSSSLMWRQFEGTKKK